MLNDPRLELLLTQVEILLILLARPVVQAQILAILGVFFLAWALDYLITKRLHNWLVGKLSRHLGQHEERWLYRFVSVLYQIYFPIIGLLLTPLAANLFERWQMPSGLIQNTTIIFWIILIYDLILTLLEVWLSRKRIHMLRVRILKPLFILLPSAVFLSQFIDLRSVLSIEMFSLLGATITLGRIGVAILWLYAFYILGWLVVGALQQVILPRTQANSGVTNSIITITRYLIIIVGFMVVFSTLGVDLTSLALIGTGLSVGIGFGMQQVVSNFISGIFLLFEQSLRPGDLIEIDNQIGTVQQLNIRSTVIRTLDAEIIVPNETFLTSQLTTFTKSNMLGRVVVPVGVSYGSNPHEVERILVETAVQHEIVLEDPLPIVFFDAFGESSLDFRLICWITEPRDRFLVRSQLHFMVWDALQEHGIEVPFPQRDLNLRGGWTDFVQTMAQRSGEADDGRLPAASPLNIEEP